MKKLVTSIALIAAMAGFSGQAIAAEPRQPHKIDILGVGPHLQMRHQPAKGFSRDLVVDLAHSCPRVFAPQGS